MTIEAVSGFADQARDSARAFRLMLDAMARPGRILPIDTALDAPASLWVSTATICLTLCDYDTPLWIDGSLRQDHIVDYLRFQTGAAIAADMKQASFLLGTPASASAALAAASRGTAEYPDASATLIIQVPSLAAGDRLILKGPGIDGEGDFRISASMSVSGRRWLTITSFFPWAPMCSSPLPLKSRLSRVRPR